MGQCDCGRIVNAPGKGSAVLCVTQCGVEIPAAEVEHVQHAEQSGLVEDVAALFGDRQASVEGNARRIAFSMHLHRRNSEPRLKMHLLECSVGGLVKGENGPLRPAMTFRKQGHRQKDRNGSGCKSDANLGIAVGAKAPFQGRANIVETGKVRCPFGPARQGRPFGPALLQPLPIVSRVANGQVGELGVLKLDVEGVGARRVQEPVAHHGPDGAGRDHRLGHQAVDGAENGRLVERRAGHDGQRRIEREMSDEHGEPAKHQAFRFGKQPIAPIQRGMQGSFDAAARCAVRPTTASAVGREEPRSDADRRLRPVLRPIRSRVPHRRAFGRCRPRSRLPRR